jgi:predicted nucleic acid-binding protein
LLDTDVFSYLMKAGDSPMKDVYKPHVKGKLVAVSFITVGELLFGAYKKNWSEAKVRDLRERLRSVVIVPYDIEVCDTYATLKSRLQADGISIADNDLWIAACAIRHAIPLISNNRSHFERVPGLILISEAPIVKEIQSQTELDLNRQPSGAGAPPGSAAS